MELFPQNERDDYEENPKLRTLLMTVSTVFGLSILGLLVVHFL